MLVVLIIGLLAVTVSLALPDSAQQQLERDARRLQAQIALAMEQAIYRNRDYGLLIGADSYRFYQREGDAWVALEADSRLTQRPLREDTELALRMDGEVLVGEAKAPQIYILSDGQVSAFELTLRHPDAERPQRLRADFGGDLQLLEVTPP